MASAQSTPVKSMDRLDPEAIDRLIFKSLPT
jgi:hypothetical protein